jgi:hypothetical protein
MDPDAALTRMRDLCHDYDAATDEWQQGQIASEIVDTFQGLDGWMSEFGYPPESWQRKDGR